MKMKSASMGIVIEIKYSGEPNLEAVCRHTLKQIEEKRYADRLIDEGMTTILKYGIACRKNGCMVRMSGI